MPGVMDTACKRARVWFPHKVINNIILPRWTRWKKAELPKEIQLNDNNSANANVNERESELVTDMERF